MILWHQKDHEQDEFDRAACTFQQALEKIDIGIKMNGNILSNIRDADDKAIFSDTPEGVLQLLDDIMDSVDQYSLKSLEIKMMINSRN